MHLLSKTRSSPAVPLRTAVLCVECESVTSARVDRCPVCGSGSVFNIAPMLGGTLAQLQETEPAGANEGLRFNVNINLDLTEIDGGDVSTTLSTITELLGVKLRQSRAALHIDVEPVVNVPADLQRQAA